MSKKEGFSCFFCDYWWLFLIFLMLIAASLLTRRIWEPYVFDPTPTSVPSPTATVVPTSTPTPTPTPLPPTPTVVPTSVTLGTGDIQITLRWADRNDLDLHVVDPAGDEIFFGQRTSRSRGKLDVDSNAGCSQDMTSSPVENIFWPTGDAPSGHYRISVVYFKKCLPISGSIPFTVIVINGGEEQMFSGSIDTESDEKVIYEFQR